VAWEGIMKVFYFTSTGNCLSVAKEFDAELLSIPKMIKEKRFEFEDKKIGFVIPTYFMGMPRIVKDFLEKATFKSEYTFVIMTYGNASGAGVNQFAKYMASKGTTIDYAEDLLMVDNYLPMFDMDEQKRKISSKKIDSNLKRIVNDISESKKYIAKKKFSEKSITVLAQAFYKTQKGTYDEKFTVSDLCTGCKICEKVCPVNNIRVEKKPVYLHHCDGCLGCINLCPEGAIKLTKEKGTSRFKNENVELKEIIVSNN